jgi:ribosome-associated toxin RatA of RatAB toxin-antitoxin module
MPAGWQTPLVSSLVLLRRNAVRRTRATDCRILPFPVGQVGAGLLDFASYPRWWPAQLRIRVLRTTPDHVGSRIEVRPRGGWFICEIAQVIPNREILIHYVDGVHRGTGRWTVEPVDGGTRVCYQIDLEPHGSLPRLLSHALNFARLHSRMMVKVFDGLEHWLSNNPNGGP